MKKLIASLAVTALVSGTAFAAPQTTTAPAAKKAAAKAKKAAPATTAQPAAPAPIVAEPVVTPAPVAVTPSSGGQSAVAMPAAASGSFASKITGKITDRASLNMNAANQLSDSKQAEGAMDPRLGYKLNDTTTVGLGTTILHSFGTTDSGKAGWTVTDIFGQVQNSNTATVLGNKLKAGARLYAPTSETSQASGQVARVRGELTIERAVGPVTLSYYASPQYYAQRNATFQNAEGKVEATRNFRLFHYLGASADLAPKLSAYTQLGLDQGWYNEDSNVAIDKNARTVSKIYTETAVEYAFNSNVSVALGIGQEDPDMLAQQPGQEGPLYRDELTSYFLEGTVSF